MGFSAVATGTVLLSTNLLSQTPSISAAPSQASIPSPLAKAAKPDPLAPELIKDFVMAGHVDLEKTKSMLQQTPTLLNAVWDWGGGDFEMAIGGAGHMGRSDIAQFLIAQGSRFDIFVAAMLGKLDVVKPILLAFPDLKTSKGPHGIPLMAHAKKGGANALEVVAFLELLQAGG